MEISPGRFNGERFRNRQTAVHKPYTLRTFHPSSLTEIRHDRSRKSPRPRPAAGTAHPVTATIAYNHNPEGTALSVTAIATDADLPGDVLTYSLLTAPDGATIDAESGVITWPTAEADGPGVYSFSVQVFDNGDPARSGEQGFHVTVLEVNTPPTLGAIPAVSGDELTAFTFTATGADADLPKQGLSFRLEGAPDGAAIDPATGAFAWTPSEEQGPGAYPIDVILTDDGAPPLSATQQVTVTVREVNAPPTLASITDQSARAGQLLTVPLDAADSDVPANELTFELVQAPSGAAIDPAARLFQPRPYGRRSSRRSSGREAREPSPFRSARGNRSGSTASSNCHDGRRGNRSRTLATADANHRGLRTRRNKTEAGDQRVRTHRHLCPCIRRVRWSLQSELGSHLDNRQLTGARSEFIWGHVPAIED